MGERYAAFIKEATTDFSNANLNDLSKCIDKVIGNNLDDFLAKNKQHGVSDNDFIDDLKSKGLNYASSTLSRIRNGDLERRIHTGFLIAFASYAHVRVEDLLEPNFFRNNTEQEIEKPQLHNYPETQSSLNNLTPSQNISSFLDSFLANNSSFVYRINGSEWHQRALKRFISYSPYSCYYLSIVDESEYAKGQDELPSTRKGKLIFQALGDICGVTLTLEYRSDDQPEAMYSGFVIVSKERGCAYCIFQGNEVKPELTFIQFRLRHGEKQHRIWDCRVGLGLTSDPERDRPTAHRFLISRTSLDSLSASQMKLIESSLKLNGSEIWIRTNSGDESITLNSKPLAFEQDAKLLTERAIRSIISEEDLPSAFAELRSSSVDRAYSKISTSVDGNLWKLLNEFCVYDDK